MLTDDWKYIEFMNREYKATYDYLFDKEEKLFYRDHRYFNQKEANGTKVFWGRGNGWVLGGLCEILQTLPRNNMHRQFYQDLFITLSDRIIQLQGKDGYWHASLLDPDSYPSPETSATGFIVYALSYGVNEGLLDKATFMPAIEKGWKAGLCTAHRCRSKESDPRNDRGLWCRRIPVSRQPNLQNGQVK